MSVIDVTQNLYDLRPVIEGVMPRVFEKLQNPHNDAPVFLLMGEQHDIPATRMMQLAILKACKDAKLSVAFGMEQPRNLISKFKDEFNGLSAKQIDLSAFWCRQDLHQLFEPIDVYAFFDNPERQHVARFCHDYCISMRFNDAARKFANSQQMDLSDEQVSEVIRDLGYQGQDRYFLVRPGDVHIRNSIMLQNMHRHIASLPKKPDVYVQMLGNLHVLGNEYAQGEYEHKNQLYPYAESLHGLLSEAGYAPLAVTIEDCAASLDGIISVQGFDNARRHFKSEKDMKGHINYISRVSQGAIPEYQEFSEYESDELQKRLIGTYCHHTRLKPSF